MDQSVHYLTRRHQGNEALGVHMAYYITEQCVDILDKSCIAECPVDCIYEGARSMYINPEECIDCGACTWACPVSAPIFEPDLDPVDEPVIARTAEWVAEHNAAGGAKDRGRVGVDHPAIAVLPPREGEVG
jgi:NAD-dependent dihydropyrimidine dehydrogenase PreA subunit